MQRSRRNPFLLLAAPVAIAAALLGALAGAPRPAAADAIELANGSIVQGRIVASQTTEDGLAVELYETGGVVLIKWDHLLASRAKELKVQTGVEAPDETAILVPGHTVLLQTNEVVQGLAMNPDAKGEPLRVRQADGERTYDRSQVAKITPTELDGLLVYKPDELYQWLRDQNPPDSAAAHKALGLQAMQIGALTKAREHLNAAKADAAFAQTAEGRSLDALLRQLDVLEKAAGAQALKRQIEDAMRRDKHNESLAKFRQLDEQFPDEQIRRAIGFSLLAQRVERERDKYFRKEVQKRVYSTMARLIEAKCREKKSSIAAANQPRGVATPGTLAAARQFCAKELPTQIWEKVGAELGLDKEGKEGTGQTGEMDRYWKERSGRTQQNASYGTGSFIVVKKPAPTSRGGEERKRRPPGSSRDEPGKGPKTPPKEDKPKTEEEWWEIVGTSDRKLWLTAYFAETSGLFTEYLRADESESCSSCGGKGVQVSSNSDGSTSQSVCTECNGCGKFRRVSFR